MEIEKRLEQMGYQLPPFRRSSVGNFVPSVRTGNLVYTAGHGPGLPGGGFLHVGKLGSELTVEQGYDCARQTMLNLLATLKEELGDLDRVTRVIKLLCMINCSPPISGTRPRWPTVRRTYWWSCSARRDATAGPRWAWPACRRVCRWRLK